MLVGEYEQIARRLRMIQAGWRRSDPKLRRNRDTAPLFDTSAVHP